MSELTQWVSMLLEDQELFLPVNETTDPAIINHRMDILLAVLQKLPVINTPGQRITSLTELQIYVRSKLLDLLPKEQV